MAKKTVKFRFYTTYNWGGDHDPAIDVLKTAMQDAGVDPYTLQSLSGVTLGTINKMFDGRTVSPRHATLGALAGALGKRWVLADSVLSIKERRK